MPVPIVCLDARLRQWVAPFRAVLSKPQYQHFVTVLFGLLLAPGRCTLTDLLRQVAGGPSLASLSRFLSHAPWSMEEVVAIWLARFQQQLIPQVAAEQERQRRARPPRRGRPPEPVVTGYLIGDDSTLAKPKGTKMGGLGRHYSSTAGTQVRGHSLVLGCYTLLGRRCPLAPQLYRQQTVCAAEGVPFQSKVALMTRCIRTFRPVPGTLTHVLLDSWYSAKSIWRAARERGFRITTGLKSNRSLRVPDPTAPTGWCWQRLPAYAAGLQPEDWTVRDWPCQGEGEPRQVYVHVVTTRVRTLYTCQLVLARTSLDGPLSAVRYWASSDLTADPATLLAHIAARWAIEVLFSDTKDLLGLDQYQLMSATAILRFWTLVLATYAFLDEERDRWQQQSPTHLTIGDARRAVQRLHRSHLLTWIAQQCHAGATPDDLSALLAA